MYSDIDFKKLEERGYFLERKYVSKNGSLYMYFAAIKKWDINPTSTSFGEPIKFSKKILLVRVSTHDKCNRLVNRKPVDINIIHAKNSCNMNELTIQIKNKLNSFKLGERVKPPVLTERERELHKFMKNAEDIFEIYFLTTNKNITVTPEILSYINNKYRILKDENDDIRRFLAEFNLIHAK